MEEEKVVNTDQKPNENGTATIPDGEERGVSTVSVKFNKQVRDIPVEEAAVLAQKGLKYELITEDFDRLKNMAKKSGLCVSEFLNSIEKQKNDSRLEELTKQTGGNRELADYILKLEKESEKTDNGFDEVKAAFPEINEIGELPEEVLSSAESGKNLLDCYLRFLLKQKRNEKTVNKDKDEAQISGVGSLKTGVHDSESAENREFLKGLFGR